MKGNQVWELRIYHYGRVVQVYDGMTRNETLAKWKELQPLGGIAPIVTVDGAELLYWQAEKLERNPRLSLAQVMTEKQIMTAKNAEALRHEKELRERRINRQRARYQLHKEELRAKARERYWRRKGAAG